MVSACRGGACTCDSSTSKSRSRPNGIAPFDDCSLRAFMSRSISSGDTVVLSAASAYPERAEEELPWHDRATEALVARLWRPLSARLRDPAKALEPIVPLRVPFANEYSGEPEEELRGAIRLRRAALQRRGFVPE